MIDKLQETYNKLIHKSDIQWALGTSSDAHMLAMGSQLQHSSWAFQEAAEMLLHDFPELIPRETIRQRQIRKGHLEEESTEEPKIKVEEEG